MTCSLEWQRCAQCRSPTGVLIDQGDAGEVAKPPDFSQHPHSAEAQAPAAGAPGQEGGNDATAVGVATGNQGVVQVILDSFVWSPAWATLYFAAQPPAFAYMSRLAD